MTSELPSGARTFYDLCSKGLASVYGGSGLMPSICAVGQVMDAAGLIDWREPVAHGHPLLTALAVSGCLPSGLLGPVVAKHGVELLTQPSEDGLPAFRAVWRARLDAASSHSGTSEETVCAWIDALPPVCLGWADASGDVWGSGWLSAALRRGQNRVVRALQARGVSVAAEVKGKPLALSFQEAEQWTSFLQAEGDPLRPGLDPEFPDEPLWETALFSLQVGKLRA